MAVLSSPTYIEIPRRDVQFDVDEFDAQIRAHGVPLQHYRAMRCPVGLADVGDQRRPHDHHEGCSNGFIYTLAGGVTGLFTSNSKQKRHDDQGVQEPGTAQLSLPRFYDDDETQEVLVAPFDRIYFADEAVTTSHWEVVTHNATGADRLSRPAIKVQDLVDWRGARYAEGSAFAVVGGKLAWKTRPEPQPDGGPAVYTVRYTYRPYWYVQSMSHDARVARRRAPDGSVQLVRMPQAFSVVREFIFEGSSQHDDLAVRAEPGRQAPPPDGEGGW